LEEGVGGHSDHQHECLGDRCVFVRGEPPRLPSVTSSGESLTWSVPLDPQFAFDALRSERLVALAGFVEPPARPYLLYQVLLI
jgi:hypothetical protein